MVGLGLMQGFRGNQPPPPLSAEGHWATCSTHASLQPDAKPTARCHAYTTSKPLPSFVR